MSVPLVLRLRSTQIMDIQYLSSFDQWQDRSPYILYTGPCTVLQGEGGFGWESGRGLFGLVVQSLPIFSRICLVFSRL